MSKNGGNLAGVGAVAFQFDRKGQFIIDSKAITEDSLMEISLEAGAEDVLDRGDHFEVLCSPSGLRHPITSSYRTIY